MVKFTTYFVEIYVYWILDLNKYYYYLVYYYDMSSMVNRFISGLSGLNILKSVDYFSDHDGTCSKAEHCTEDSYIMKNSEKNLKDSKKNHKR